MKGGSDLRKRKGDGEGSGNRKRTTSNGVCANVGVREGGDISCGRSDQVSRSGTVGGGTSEGPMTRRRRREVEIERRRNLQLHEMTPVVVLEPFPKGDDEHGIFEKRSRATENGMLRRMREAKRQEVGQWRRLPPEMLEMIMSKITDEAILHNCSLASPILSGILWPRKTNYLFMQAFPHIIKHLSTADIHNCRLTARDWRKGVDEVIRYRPANQPYNNKFFLEGMEYLSNRRDCGVTPYMKFNPTIRLTTTRLSFENFQETYQSLNLVCQSSFFGNSVELYVELENPHNHNGNQLVGDVLNMVVPESWPLIRFLMYFRQLIHHLRLKLEVHQASPAAVIKTYVFAQTLLEMCENLRTFSISVPTHVNQDLDRLIGNMLQGDNWTPNVLRHLHTMELILPLTMPTSFMIRILNLHLPMLEKLTISRWMDSFKKELPRLKELNVMSIDTEENFKQLDGIRAPVEKLTLRFGYEITLMRKILPVLRQFPSLRHLTLNWVFGTNVRMMEMVPPPKECQIPTVHTLKMAHSLNVNYSFLLCFPNLRYLFLEERVPSDGNRHRLDYTPPSSVLDVVTCHEVVQINKFLYGGVVPMLRSNVWTLLPKLGTIVFERVDWVQHPLAAEDIGNLQPSNREKRKIVWERWPDKSGSVPFNFEVIITHQ